MLNGAIEPGLHAVTWNRRTDGDRLAAPGLYFVRGHFKHASGGTETLRGRIVVVK